MAIIFSRLRQPRSRYVYVPLATLRILRRHRPYDVWIDANPWSRLSALLSYGAGARWTLGFATAGQHRHALFDCAVEHSRHCHELENYRALLRPLGVDGRRGVSAPGAPAAGWTTSMIPTVRRMASCSSEGLTGLNR